MMNAFYCKKCGQISTSCSEHPRCNICGTYQSVIPKQYLIIEGVGMLKHDLKEEFIDKYIKSSPDFDSDLFNKKDKILAGEEPPVYIPYYRTSNQRYTMQSSVSHQHSPKCPICQSTNLSKISSLKKAAKVGLFGIFGAGDIGKTWKCNNCGSRF